MNSKSNETGGEAQPVRALVRGLRLLEVLAEASPIGVTEIAKRAGLSGATAHRLLATLSAEGYVTQDARHDRYRLGPRLFALASAAESEVADLRRRALPVMARLRDVLGETVNLAVLDRHDIVYVDQVESDRPLRAFNRIGNRVPAHASAAGKALLAFRAPVDDGWPLEALTKTTITSPKALAKHLEAVRRQGFALDIGEHDEDVLCVAAPIPGAGEVPAGALSVSGPAERLRRLDLDAIGREVAAHAAQVTR